MKDLDKLEVMSKAEAGFMGFIVLPLWDLMDRFLNGELEDVVINLSLYKI
jgi:hypothetical protein